MEECIFCKIAAGQMADYKIYEDEAIIAFLDVMPVLPGHILVVPKAHVENLEAASPELLAKLMAVIQKLAPTLHSALGAFGFNLAQNNGAVAGQVVNHLHFHLIPRHEAKELALWPGKSYAPGEAEAITEKLKQALS